MTIIKQVCVIGAGVMGSGIAAQVANSGIKVLLLDVVSKEMDRSSIARSAIDKMHKTKPLPLSHPKRAELISAGNLDDDLGKIKDCEFIIEVIVEKLEVKHDLYNKLLPYLNPDAILTSNTSTLPLKRLKENLPANIAHRFMITHFFNPPRYMRLLELITDKTTDHKAIEEISQFVTYRLGKSIVPSNDTPGFIANRIGCFLLELVLRKAISYNINVATMDRMLIQKMSLPNTGIFGLYDLIGLDVMGLIAKSLLTSLPKDDRFVQIFTNVPLVQKMVRDGFTGRKGLGGFYKMHEEGGKKTKEVIDLQSGEYIALPEEEDLDRYDKISTEVMNEFEAYVRSLVPEVTDKPEDIDRAMKLGYSWKYGPFELFSKNSHAVKSASLSYRNDNIEREDNLKSNCNIFDIGTKMNCLTSEVFHRLIEAVEKAETMQKPLYIYSKDSNFSAGADLKFLLQKIQSKDWNAIEDYLSLGQKAMKRIKYAKVPVISCARGVALGGGCELLLHSHFVVANQQLNAGLIEVSLGLIPAFGGTKEMVLRAEGDATQLQKLLGNIVRQNKSSSADYFSESYRVPLYVNMNRDHLLQEAVTCYKKQNNVEWGGASSCENLSLDEHSKLIAKKLEDFTKDNMSEDALLDLEREVFMELVKTPIVEEKIAKIVK